MWNFASLKYSLNSGQCSESNTIAMCKMNHVTRKPAFGVCVQSRLKPACAATEASTLLAQADLCLCCSHMAKHRVSYDVAQILSVLRLSACQSPSKLHESLELNRLIVHV